MTNVNPTLRLSSVTARTPASKAAADVATPPSRQAISEASNSPYSPLSLEDDDGVSMRPIRMEEEERLIMRNDFCFPLDLDLVPLFPQQPRSNEAKDYNVADLQRISRDARDQLMELTVSRHGRELQRWEYLSGGDLLPFHHSSTTPPPNCRLTTGCIPILPEGRILLISSSKSRNVFVLPKGGWEQDESLPLSALRETLEEAGVTGLLGPPLPPLTYETKKSLHRRRRRQEEAEAQQNDESTHRIVTSESPVSSDHTHNRLVLFPMYVQCLYEHWPEREKRTRRIVTMDEAAELLQHRPEFSFLLEELRKRQWHTIVPDDEMSRL